MAVTLLVDNQCATVPVVEKEKVGQEGFVMWGLKGW